MHRPRVIVAGSSARAAAESAARAGFPVTALDAFADIDQHPAVHVIGLDVAGGPFRPARVARAAQEIQADVAVYLAGFENHPQAVRVLGAGRRLWGNAPPVLRQVRDPFTLARRMAAHGFTVPELRRLSVLPRGDEPGEPIAAANQRPRIRLRGDTRVPSAAARWLVKPFASGGGRRVRAWRGKEAEPTAVPRDCYLQALVEGTPASIVFVAAGGRARPMGLSRQLVGERIFGSSGYRYCGSILAPEPLGLQTGEAARLRARVVAMAGAAVEAFGLVGVNGIDFMLHGEEPYPIEVNPRWCASMELVERASGMSVFALHALACETGTLPEVDLGVAPRRFLGKAILFAPCPLVVGDSRVWLGDPDVRDVPRPGAIIRARQPICTIFASGDSDGDCHAALARRAGEMYQRIAAWRRRIA